MPNEVATLIDRRTEPQELAIVQHGIQEHHALDHAPRCRGLPESVVRFADSRPERLVVDVKHPSAMELPGHDRRGEPPLDQPREEVRALLAVDDAGEGAVLALHEDARVQQDVEQEPRLALGEAERCDRLQALGVRQVNCPTIRRGWQPHRSNSSTIRGCRPPPPRPPTEHPIER